MSRSSLIVALDNAARIDGNLEQLVRFQIERPYEQGESFYNGAPLKGYRIGGRYTGLLGGEDYIRVRDIDKAKFTKVREERLRRTWKNAMASLVEASRPPVPIASVPASVPYDLYGFDPREKALEEYVAEQIAVTWFPPSDAFLRNLQWHRATPLEFGIGTLGIGRLNMCQERFVLEDEFTGAQFTVWNEPKEVWEKYYYPRFIEKLPPDTVLVIVDWPPSQHAPTELRD
jgi:hypothetical protein